MEVGRNPSGDFELGHISEPHRTGTSGSSSPPLGRSPKAAFNILDYANRVLDNERDGFVLYTIDEERAVVRKLDRRLVLFVAALYLLSFLDRSSKLDRQGKNC